MRTVGPCLLGGLWFLLLTPIALAVREGDWTAPVRDAGLGAPGAVAGWVVLGVLALVLPVVVIVLLTHRTVLDGTGVEAAFGRGRFELAQVDEVRWVRQGGPVGAGQRPEHFEVHAGGVGLVARVARGEADWEASRAVLRHWARLRPELVRDEETAAVLAPGAA